MVSMLRRSEINPEGYQCILLPFQYQRRNGRAFNRLLPTNTGPCGRFVTGNKSIKCVNWKFIFAKKPAMGIV